MSKPGHVLHDATCDRARACRIPTAAYKCFQMRSDFLGRLAIYFDTVGLSFLQVVHSHDGESTGHVFDAVVAPFALH